ncbi:MAG TPA: ABC transporter permease [Polyangiales bacterium]|nr:ABC transporter permease [Polyangiales bacterium]
MLLHAIDKKLWRELTHMKGQIATIALVLASGIASFIMLRGTVESLSAARDDYYDRYRFAHVFVRLERAPESLVRRIEALPGVGVVQTRIARPVLLPIEGMQMPASGQLLSLPASHQPATNAVYLERGRFPEPGRDDEVVLLEAFARAHRLQPGHHVQAILHGRKRSLRVVGIGRSPEFIYALRPGAMISDPKRSAVLWMDRAALASAFELDGSFDELSLRVQPGASEPAIRAALDRLLLPYGGDGAYSRKDQLSHRILNGELGQLTGIASMVPLVFLGVAVFLMRLVLGRLIALQRSEIALLKAIGYTNFEVGRHYLGLVAVVMLPASLAGVALGAALGRVVLGLYAPVFQFPNLRFVLSPQVVAIALLSSMAAAVGGALLAVRSAVKLPPAEAMRPPSPARYRASAFDRFGLAQLVGPSGMMVVRELQRRPLRTAMSSLGIAGAVSLMILGRFGQDSLDRYLDQVVLREHRQDLSVLFSEPVQPRVVDEIARLPGVLTSEGVRAVRVRVHNGHRSRDAALMGLPAHGKLRRLLERSGSELQPPEQGVLITKTLGEVLGVRPGQRIDLDVREGERPLVRPIVAGFIDETTGLQVYASDELVARLRRDLGAVSAVMLRVDPSRRAALIETLKGSPHALDISEIGDEVQRQRNQHRDVFKVWTAISSLLAAAVIFGVVYNNARIALTARSRDLASLRVLGFSRREISSVLLWSQAAEVALAIPFGLWLGRVWSEQFMGNIDQEQFRWAATVSSQTYVLAVGVTLLASGASALWVRRGLDRLDLIGVLKTRE